MEILTLKSVISKGKYANKTVSELLEIKGQIMSMIKEGYVFDDEVLSAANIRKTISNVKTFYRFNKGENVVVKELPKETASVKQILSEINTIDTIGGNSDDDKYDNRTGVINVDEFDGEDE